ncbi:MAG: putative glycoside hydrolase, partial [Spirochaetota bacterium]
TWSKKMMSDPYYTVFLTSSKANERTKHAEIVSYIQAFKIRVNKSDLSYDDYVLQQIKAVHDSNIKGYILWNAAQEYTVPFKVAEDYYKKNPIQPGTAAVKAKKTDTL